MKNTSSRAGVFLCKKEYVAIGLQLSWKIGFLSATRTAKSACPTTAFSKLINDLEFYLLYWDDHELR
jgi:hypothetical protein